MWWRAEVLGTFSSTTADHPDDLQDISSPGCGMVGGLVAIGRLRRTKKQIKMEIKTSKNSHVRTVLVFSLPVQHTCVKPVQHTVLAQYSIALRSRPEKDQAIKAIKTKSSLYNISLIGIIWMCFTTIYYLLLLYSCLKCCCYRKKWDASNHSMTLFLTLEVQSSKFQKRASNVGYNVDDVKHRARAN